MRLVIGVSIAALLFADAPAQAGFFLDRSPSGAELAATEFAVMLPRAQAGNASNQYFVGLYRYFGLGVERDRAEGLDWLRRAAEQGIGGAQYMLGFLYGSGLGPSLDPVEANRWYQAAEQGWTGGGPDWRMGFNFGEGSFTISTAAIQVYTTEAEQGDLGARLKLSYFYGSRFVRSGMAPDADEMLKWIRLAAETEHPSALNNLGVLHANGWGVPQDDRRAIELFRRAADAGVPEAQLSLGIMAASGRGMATDLTEAAKWYALAAESGKPLAQIALAWAYAKGEGVARDYTQVLQWLIRVSDKGCAIEASLLGVGVGMLIEEQMPAAYQLAEAKHGPCN